MISKIFIGIILISLSILGSAMMIHTHEFLKKESSSEELNRQILS